jgi:hypothetical protein
MHCLEHLSPTLNFFPWRFKDRGCLRLVFPASDKSLLLTVVDGSCCIYRGYRLHSPGLAAVNL